MGKAIYGIENRAAVKGYIHKVSIIVPIYNLEKYVRHCVDSILVQTYTDFELLLIDDGSKDGSGKICDEYAELDSRIHVFHKENGGLCSARNHGLDKARGEWIMYVDGDDWLEPDTLELLLLKAEETGADIVFADFWFDFSDRRIESGFYDWRNQGINGLREYIVSPWNCIWGSIQKKSIYDENGLRSPETITYCEDFHLIVRLCFFARLIAKVNKPLFHYRQRESLIMHNLNRQTESDEQWAYADIISFF